MLELRHVSYAYPCAAASAEPHLNGGGCAVADISFTVRPGERVAVLGPNGSGKSTLLACLCARVAPDEGAVVLDGAEVGRNRARQDALRRAAGIVGQDPDNQMVASTVFEEVAFGPCNLGLPAGEIRNRVADALAQCDLAELGDRDVATLSGGQRQRVAIAGMVAMQPTYLLCDEPCSMLDQRARYEVLAVLERAARGGCGIVHATHELSEAIAYDRAVVMENGRIVWEGAPCDLLMDEGACQTAACFVSPWLGVARTLVRHDLLSSREVKRGPRHCAAALAARGGCGGAMPIAAQVRAVAADRDAAGRTTSFCDGGRRCLAVRGVGHAFGSRRSVPDDGWVLRDVDVAVRPGEVLLVAGPTGSGKSTLAHIASGLLNPIEGTATVDGVPVTAGSVGHSFQRAEDQLFADTVLEDVSFGPRNLGCTCEQAAARAKEALGCVGLDEGRFGDANPFLLSGGQMRRAAIAGVLAMKTGYVVMDEPTAGLDARGMRDFASIVAGLAHEGVGVAIVSHDVARVSALADRAVLLAKGHVVWEGPAASLFACPSPLALAGLPADDLAVFERACGGAADDGANR